MKAVHRQTSNVQRLQYPKGLNGWASVENKGFKGLKDFKDLKDLNDLKEIKEHRISGKR